jgi:hypothetical protein
MFYGKPLTKPAEKTIAAKMEEALGLLTLVKPLLKKAGKLTNAEQEVLGETLSQASHLLHEATGVLYDRYAANATRGEPENGTSTAVRPG